VVTPLDGTPAAKAGILENDIITKLDGEPVQGFTLNQAVEKMHGPVGTKVTLTIVRMGEDKSIDLTITREPIRILAAESRNASPVIDWSSCLDAEATADRSKEPEFSVAMAKRVYYGPVYIGRRSEPYMTLSLAGTGRYSGVSVAEVNLRLIWDIVSGMKIGERGVVYVVDADGKLIAHPDLSLVLSKTNLSGLAQVQAARAATSSAAGEPSMRTRDIQGRDVLAAFAPVARGRGYSACACQGIGWSVLVELPTDEAGVQ
jgi:membrane-associated protease RseP (regulator of RpoE activity)